MSTTLHIGTDTYRLDKFPLPATTETNPAPLDICINNGYAYCSCEFDRKFYRVALNALDNTTCEAIAIPRPSSIFRLTLFNQDNPSLIAAHENVRTDAAGVIWMSECGALPYMGRNLNASRVIRYDPNNSSTEAFSLPFDNAGVVGLYIDGARLWVTCASPQVGAQLLVTRPASWPRSLTSPSSMPGTIPQGTELAGWRSLTLPGTFPAHMTIGPDGRLWITCYWSNSVLAVNRDTLAIQSYPLPATTLPLGRGPWQLTFDLGGGLWVSCDNAREIAKLIPSTGEWIVYPTGCNDNDQVHSLAINGGSIWFTAYGVLSGGRIGRRTATGIMELSEPFDSVGLPKGAAGIAFDYTGAIWISLFGSQAIGRLTKI